MNMKHLKKAAAVSLAALAAAGMIAGCGGEKKASAPSSQPAAQTVKINFPTAGASGALYAVGAAITNMWNNNVPGVQAASQASAGGIANLNMVSDGEAQVSIAISSNVYQCLNGTDSFKDHPYKDLKVIAGLYMNPNQVVVTAKSGIQTLADVKGKHFAVASAGSSVYNESNAHFTAAGLKFPDDIQAEYITFTDAVDIDDQLVEKLKAKYPWYASYTIKASTYPNQDRDVHTTAVKMVMFTRGDMPEDVVYNLTKAFCEHIDELGQAQKNLKGLKPEDAVKDIAGVPLHPGAERYYREIGVLK